jgi:hypothetical protein
MLNRREFLSLGTGGVVTLVLTRVIVGCGSSSSDNTSTTSTNPTIPGCDGAGETSTVTQGHTHDLCVPASDLSSPPAGGATYTTSISVGHDHNVTLTQAQLTTVSQGGAVTVTTSTVTGHTHDFSVQKAAQQVTPAPQPTTGTGGGY